MNRFLETILRGAVLILLALALTSCKKEEEERIVSLKAFGPYPVLHGETLTFIGENLDLVTTIVFPESVSVAEIEVVSPRIVKAVVPDAAVNGQIKLLGPDIEVTSKIAISFPEPAEAVSEP